MKIYEVSDLLVSENLDHLAWICISKSIESSSEQIRMMVNFDYLFDKKRQQKLLLRNFVMFEPRDDDSEVVRYGNNNSFETCGNFTINELFLTRNLTYPYLQTIANQIAKHLVMTTAIYCEDQKLRIPKEIKNYNDEVKKAFGENRKQSFKVGNHGVEKRIEISSEFVSESNIRR